MFLFAFAFPKERLKIFMMRASLTLTQWSLSEQPEPLVIKSFTTHTFISAITWKFNGLIRTSIRLESQFPDIYLITLTCTIQGIDLRGELTRWFEMESWTRQSSSASREKAKDVRKIWWRVSFAVLRNFVRTMEGELLKEPKKIFLSTMQLWDCWSTFTSL